MAHAGFLLAVRGLFPDMIESVECLREGARSGLSAHLDRAEAIALRIHISEHDIAKISAFSTDPASSVYISLPGHAGRISGYLQVIASALKVKNRDKVLFSEKAMDEMDLLFNMLRKLMELAMAAVPGISGASSGQAGGITEVDRAASGLEACAGEFLGLHEERLLEGLCLPKASSIYLEMLDGCKAICWHVSEMARKTAGDGP